MEIRGQENHNHHHHYQYQINSEHKFTMQPVIYYVFDNMVDKYCKILKVNGIKYNFFKIYLKRINTSSHSKIKIGLFVDFGNWHLCFILS